VKILLINNHTQHLPALTTALADHNVEIQIYEPGLDFHYQGKDLVILSGGGGEGLEIYDKFNKVREWYDDQREFMLKYDGPLLGICMGFEVICSAYGSKVEEMTDWVRGLKELHTSRKGKASFATAQLQQSEAHKWRVASVPSKFQVLAHSNTGIEAIRYKNILATQFHPELPGTLQLPQLLKASI